MIPIDIPKVCYFYNIKFGKVVKFIAFIESQMREPIAESLFSAFFTECRREKLSHLIGHVLSIEEDTLVTFMVANNDLHYVVYEEDGIYKGELLNYKDVDSYKEKDVIANAESFPLRGDSFSQEMINTMFPHFMLLGVLLGSIEKWEGFHRLLEEMAV